MISGSLPCPRISPINERLLRRHIQAALIQTFFLEQTHHARDMSGRQFGYLAEALGTARAFFATDGPQSLTGFAQWLNEMLEGQNPVLLPQMTVWLPTTIAGATLSEQQKYRFVREVANKCVERLRDLAEQLFLPAPSVSRSVSKQGQSFPIDTEEMLLEILFEHDFLPTYAFPREVRSFVIEAEKQDRFGRKRIGIVQRPQQSVDIALSEYAPGRELIVDKTTYRVGGIYVDPFLGATVETRVASFFARPCRIFALCLSCGYTVQIETTKQGKLPEQCCPLCQGSLTIKEILDPPGYAPECARSLQQSQIHSDGSRNGSTMQVQLVLPQSQADTFDQWLAGGRVAWSCTEHHQLLIVNSGTDHQGFSICRSCGTSEVGNPTWLRQGLDRPFLTTNAPKKCYAPQGIWQGYLGHVFYSDLFMWRRPRMSLPSLTEAIIRQYASSESFQRGREYYQQGAVFSLVRRDMMLRAEVEGSSSLPYMVSCLFQADGTITATCSCPYDWGGWCKHIVAACLAIIHQPEMIEERPALKDLLSCLDRKQLQALVLQLAEREPPLIDVIEELVGVSQSPSPKKTVPRRAHVDAQAVRRQVRSLLHSLDRMRSSEAYWHVGSVVNEIRQLLERGWTLIQADDGRNALSLLEAVTEAYISDWTNLDDSDGSASGFFQDLGPIWTEALLSADLSSKERKAWANTLKAWQREIDDYGVEEVFDAAQQSACRGGTRPSFSACCRAAKTPHMTKNLK